MTSSTPGRRIVAFAAGDATISPRRQYHAAKFSIDCHAELPASPRPIDAAIVRISSQPARRFMRVDAGVAEAGSTRGSVAPDFSSCRSAGDSDKLALIPLPRIAGRALMARWHTREDAALSKCCRWIARCLRCARRPCLLDKDRSHYFAAAPEMPTSLPRAPDAQRAVPMIGR